MSKEQQSALVGFTKLLAVIAATFIAASCATQLPLSSTEDPQQLHASLTFREGGDAENHYDLTTEPGNLTLCAGPDTDQWGARDAAPSISYLPEGDFTARVTMRFEPTGGHEFAGLGLRSATDQNSWIRIGKAYGEFPGFGKSKVVAVDANYNGRSGKHAVMRHKGDIVYFKISKSGRLFSAFYSDDGKSWSSLLRDHEFDLPGDDLIYLTTVSWGPGSTCAAFSNFSVAPL